MSGPQIMFVCDYCSEHNPEMCGHYDAEDIRLAPNGSWLCESCFDEETPSELGRFSDAPIAYLEATPSPSPAPGVVEGQAAGDAESPLEWAVRKWHHEVANRPLENVHRAALDTTWRQVIRHFGGDAEVLCGPDHYTLVEQNPAALASLQPAKGEREGERP